MAKKKSFAKKELVKKKQVKKKTTKKKTTKKSSVVKKKVVEAKKEEVPENIRDKQMTGEEMANMETYFAEMSQAKAEMHTQEQYKKNLLLEKENMELKLQLLETDIKQAGNYIQQKQDKYDSVNSGMVSYIDKLKSKYGVTSAGSIKYDRMSGKILE